MLAGRLKNYMEIYKNLEITLKHFRWDVMGSFIFRLL